MFEIGSSLREARRRRGLELDAVQKALRLRRRYLEALENERFELLPGEAYARGFLREYAEFLGLDGSLYVEEYNARFARHEETPIVVRRSAPRLTPTLSRRTVALTALGIVAVVGALAAWETGNRTPGTTVPAVDTSATGVGATKTPTTHRQTTSPAAAGTAPQRSQTLTLTATRGDCWIGVRVGSSTGKQLYWSILRQGQTLHFGLRQPLWIRVGAGQNVDAHIGTRTVTLPQLVGDVVVPAVS